MIDSASKNIVKLGGKILLLYDYDMIYNFRKFMEYYEFSQNIDKSYRSHPKEFDGKISSLRDAKFMLSKINDHEIGYFLVLSILNPEKQEILANVLINPMPHSKLNATEYKSYIENKFNCTGENYLRQYDIVESEKQTVLESCLKNSDFIKETKGSGYILHHESKKLSVYVGCNPIEDHEIELLQNQGKEAIYIINNTSIFSSHFMVIKKTQFIDASLNLVGNSTDREKYINLVINAVENMLSEKSEAAKIYDLAMKISLNPKNEEFANSLADVFKYDLHKYMKTREVSFVDSAVNHGQHSNGNCVLM